MKRLLGWKNGDEEAAGWKNRDEEAAGVDNLKSYITYKPIPAPYYNSTLPVPKKIARSGIMLPTLHTEKVPLCYLQ